MTDNTVRYGICDREDDPFMERCEDGDWVNFADYTALATLAELTGGKDEHPAPR